MRAPKSTHEHLRLASFLAKLFDNQFSLFGVGFGLDTIIGFIPGVGDVITTSFALYLVWIGWHMHIPRPALIKMLVNVGIDFVLGVVPLVGDVADAFFQANQKNLEILKRYDKGDVIEGEVIR